MSAIDPAISGLLAAQQNALSSKIATSLQGKRLDAVEQQGQSAVALIDKAAEISQPKANGAGQGGRLDVRV